MPHSRQKIYCDSYDCPYRCIPIDDDDEVKCKWGKCTKSQFCDTVRSSYHCPKYYELTDDTYTTVCEYDKCTEDQCCETSEQYSRCYRSPTGFEIRLLIFTGCFTVPPPVGFHLL